MLIALNIILDVGFMVGVFALFLHTIRAEQRQHAHALTPLHVPAAATLRPLESRAAATGTVAPAARIAA